MPEKAAVLQMCVGEECYVYHVSNADQRSVKLHPFLQNWHYTFAGLDIINDQNCLSLSGMYISNFKDIQRIWRDPDNKKRKQGLKDVAAAIIDVN